MPFQDALEKQGRWEKVLITDPLPYLPLNPEYGKKIEVTVHIYRAAGGPGRE